MATAMSAKSCVRVMSRAWRGGTAKTAVLIAGIVSVGVYIVGDVLSGLLYEGYSFADQAISELSAIGSPVRPLMVTFLTVHGLLLVAFSVGVWRAGDRSRALRCVGVLLLAAAVVGLIIHPFFPMSTRGMEGGFNDTLHIALTGVFGLLVFAGMLFAAVAYQGQFRVYSIGSLLVLMVSGWLASTFIQDIAENVATPWLGAFERVNAYVYLAWLVVLAVMVGDSP